MEWYDLSSHKLLRLTHMIYNEHALYILKIQYDIWNDMISPHTNSSD